MKIFVALVLTLVCVASIISCSKDIPDVYNEGLDETMRVEEFIFSYEIIEGIIEKGQRIAIKVTLTNNLGVSYKWTGSQSSFRANVKLFTVNGVRESGTESEYIFNHELIADTSDHNDHEILKYEGRSFVFYFTIPTDAVLGDYNLTCSFKDSSKTFNKIFTLR